MVEIQLLSSYNSGKLSDRVCEVSMVDFHGNNSSRGASASSLASFLDTHNFLMMYGVDSCRISILQSLEGKGTSVEVTVGLLSLFGCIDSYYALTVCTIKF